MDATTPRTLVYNGISYFLSVHVTSIVERWNKTQILKNNELYSLETPNNNAEKQLTNEVTGPIFAWKLKDTRPSWQERAHLSSIVKGYWAIWHALIVDQQVLRRNSNARKKVPQVLKEMHNATSGDIWESILLAKSQT